MEAEPALEPRDSQGLVANVLVYDNHVETARQLQVGPANTCIHTHVRRHGRQTKHIDPDCSFGDLPDFTWK